MPAEQVEKVDRMAVIRPTDPVEQPPRTRQLCRSCGALLGEVLQAQGLDIHPNCEENELRFNTMAPEPGTDHPMRTELIELIRFADRSAYRNSQKAIGPSEIGNSCDRRLAYRIAGVKAVNRTSDPWPAIVGTAMHDWLQRCLERDNARYVAAGQQPRWITEKRVQPDPLIHGTSDAYDTHSGTVVDWKSMGDTAKAKLIKEGPSEGYFTQIQTYGLGFHRAGFQVQRVGLMFLPRAGHLKDARYYEWPFNPAVAQAAIDRVYSIGRNILATRQSLGTDEIWNVVPADASQLCGWCPFFTRSVSEASSRGCPGH